jgi:hypothetical protein
MLTLKGSMPNNPVKNFTEKYEKMLGKILVQTQHKHPDAFLPAVPPFLQFCLENILKFSKKESVNRSGGEEDEEVERNREIFLVKCMEFVKNVLACGYVQKLRTKFINIIINVITA